MSEERREMSRSSDLLLVEIKTLLAAHVLRFEDHVKDDDKRELEHAKERQGIAQRVLDVERMQNRQIGGFALLVILVQVAMKLWK